MTAPGERRAQVTRRAPAKVNLYLEVLGRRPDGYHELRTVMQTVDLCDEVGVALRPRDPGRPDAPAHAARTARAHPAPGRRATPAPDVRLRLRTPAADVPAGPDNLAVRAAATLLERVGATGDLGVDLTLAKRIPAGGGLGGGSSDAAAVLVALNELLGRPVDEPGLHALASGLGSDVAFFLHGGTALCTGRGEHVRPLRPPRPFGLTLLLPPFAVSTAAVYGALDAPALPAAPVAPQAAGAASAVAGVAELVERVEDAPTEELERLFRNDLEPAARRADPRLAPLLDVPGLHLSGSGSTLFGFGRRERDIHAACESALICFVDSRIGKA